MTRFATRLLKWYQEHGRALPWRGTAEPYSIWVSEIMLQQTRVEAAIPYFQRWMERFPTVEALARASEREVLSLWEGLGYYARARNLRRAAQIVMEGYGGRLPATAKELHRLPGVGRYTAGAIASIAFGRDEPALDGNIQRVLARVFDVTEAADTARGAARLWELAAEHLPRGRAGDYNQALMDLGATICLPREPRCSMCPVNVLCKARKLGLQTERPRKARKKKAPHRVLVAAVIIKRGRVLLAQRPSRGLLGGMWEFPGAQVRGAPARQLADAIRKGYDLKVEGGELLGILRHAYSHFSVTVHAYRCQLLLIPNAKNLRWVRRRDLSQFPMGRVDRQIARKLA
jgi:A/G-specific adenine glycosylase